MHKNSIVMLACNSANRRQKIKQGREVPVVGFPICREGILFLSINL